MRAFVLLLLVLPATAAPADTSHTWFLTGETGDLDAFGLEGVQFMQKELAGTDSQARFSSLEQGIPGNPLVPSDGVVRSVSWYLAEPWGMDMEILEDATVVLYVEASAQASAQAKVVLRALSPEGAVTVAEQSRTISIGNANAEQELFALAARGEILPEGSILELTVTIEGASLATVVRYDAEANPSRLDGLRARPLDSDGDGLPDTLERRAGSDPMDGRSPGDSAFDTDGDGLPDDVETALGTDPHVADSDGDGWSDGAERVLGSDPLDGSSAPADADGDGLADEYEDLAGTRSDTADSDGDGTSDCDEDPDGDGLTNCQEQSYGSQPLDADSDHDGIEDGLEVQQGTDPALHGRPPAMPAPIVAEIALASVFLAAGLAMSLVGLFRRHRL